ncbi:hypothetical protein GCM10009530_61410 [Microbispora corallina]|uniref:Uncharacterized protein n=1 Tax=Microbispora corallina TaxID=83302 RepID=A0ABQ4G8G7_9ACTN|nr:hypothetical protein Mco01_63270 [Microbispora corallina]
MAWGTGVAALVAGMCQAIGAASAATARKPVARTFFVNRRFLSDSPWRARRSSAADVTPSDACRAPEFGLSARNFLERDVDRFAWRPAKTYLPVAPPPTIRRRQISLTARRVDSMTGQRMYVRDIANFLFGASFRAYWHSAKNTERRLIVRLMRKPRFARNGAAHQPIGTKDVTTPAAGADRAPVSSSAPLSSGNAVTPS